MSLPEPAVEGPPRPSLSQARSRALETAVEWIIRASAFSAIVGLFLIFVFIGKEALPILTSPEVRKEANLSNLFLPQQQAHPY